MQKVVVS